MRNFILRLRPPAASLTYDNDVAVCLGTHDNIIGWCRIDHNEQGMTGTFRLNQDVDESQYIFYMFDFAEEIPYMHSILISNKSSRANTIKNSRIA